MCAKNQRTASTDEAAEVVMGVIILIVVLAVLFCMAVQSVNEQHEERMTLDEILEKVVETKWRKSDSSLFTLQFTEEGQLNISTPSDEYSAEYERYGERLLILVENFEVAGYPRYDGQEGFESGVEWRGQLFSIEILPSGEFSVVNSEGPYANEAIINQIAGHYLPIDISPSDISEAPASSRVEDLLADIVSKDEIMATQLSELKQDRTDLVARLRSAGIQSASDLEHTPSVRHLVSELMELVQHISNCEKRHVEYVALIDKLESAQRRFKRREEITGTELSATDHDAISEVLADVDKRLAELFFDELDYSLNVELILEQELAREPE